MGGITPIPDAHMTASSIRTQVFGFTNLPHYARLHGTSAWCSSTAEKDATVPNMYLQVSITIFKVAFVWGLFKRSLNNTFTSLRSVRIINVAGLTVYSLFQLEVELFTEYHNKHNLLLIKKGYKHNWIHYWFSDFVIKHILSKNIDD